MMRGLCVLLGAFAVASCATTSSGPATLPPVLSPWSPPTAQQCHTYVDTRFMPPPAAQFVEFRALQRALDRAPGYAVLEVEYDSMGVRQTEARYIEGDLLPAVLARVDSTIPRKLPVLPKVHEEGRIRGWMTTLRLDAGGPPSVRFGPIEVCRPRLVNQSEIARFLTGLASHLMNDVTLRGTRQVLVMDIHLDSTGVPIRHVPAPGQPRPRADIMAAITQVVPEMRFHPMIANRRPVRSTARMPLTLDLTGRTAPVGPR